MRQFNEVHGAVTMIIYSGSKADFMVQVEEDTIAYTIRDNILEKMHRKTPDAEFRSWVNSLEYMYKVLNDDGIPRNSGIAIEYNLPNTAKRVDFLVSGYDAKRTANVVIIELKQALNTVNIYSDILTGTMDAFASIISNNVNTIMKRMTSLSIVLMLPTLIASFYGMNVDIHLEEVPFAFSLIVLFSIGLSTLAFVIFRKIKWF